MPNMLKRVSSMKKSMTKKAGPEEDDGGGAETPKKSKKDKGGAGGSRKEKKGSSVGKVKKALKKGGGRKGGGAIVGQRMDVEDSYVPVQVEKNPKTRRLILDVLDHLTIFQELSFEQKEAIMLCMTEVRTPSGKDLIVQGETGNAFYIVESGQFQIFVDGKQVATSEEGGSFGELALVMDQLRAATVTASKDSLCWKLDRAPFRKYMASSTAGELTHIIEGLKKIQLLAGLSESHLSQLALHTSTEQFYVGSRIICKDEVGDKFYMMKEGAVRCANIGRGGNKVGYVDLGKGAHFGERALIRDELRASARPRPRFNALSPSRWRGAHARARRARDRTRARASRRCDVIAMKPTVCYTVGREDFVALLGNLSEAMERSLAVAVIKSLPDIAADPLAAAVVRDNPATFEQLSRKEYKPGEIVSANVANLEKLIVVRKGTIELETPGSSTSWFQMEKRNLVTSGRVLGIHALGVHPKCADARARAKDSVLVYEFDPCVITEERKRRAADAHLVKTLPKFKDLDIKRTLGMGTFGRVKLCTHQSNGHTAVYALKMLVKHMMAEMKQTHAILYERRVLKDLKHPFVLRLMTTYQSMNVCYFLLELVQGGELFSRLTCFAMDAFPLEEAKFYASTTMDALCYIHSKSIVYRDLKPENILIDAGGYIRIVDFGFAKVLKTGDQTYTIVGTPEYLAPECVLGQGYRFDVDLWAFGCLVYEMSARRREAASGGGRGGGRARAPAGTWARRPSRPTTRRTRCRSSNRSSRQRSSS